MAMLTNANLALRQQQLHQSLSRLPDAERCRLPFSDEELKAFQQSLQGTIVLPGDPTYPQDRKGHSLVPDLPYPCIIVYCAAESDVAACLALVTKYRDELPFAVRSGGHSNTGYSVVDGMVIDISNLNGVFVSPDRTTAVVQAGATLGLVNAELDLYGLHIPGGECATVGVAGHMQGGGYGFTSRTFGLNCDVVERVRVMLADGKIVVADETQNTDLYWAIRGATGGTLGILLEVEYRTAPLSDLWAFVIEWPIDQAAQVLPELQRNYMQTGLTPKLGYQCAFSRIRGAEDCSFLFMGMYAGPREEGKGLIAPLMTIGTPNLLQEQVARYKNLSDFLLNWWEIPPDLETVFESKQSNYIARTLEPSEWTEIIDYFKTTPNLYNLCAFEVYGGAAASPQRPNAFIHRDVDFDFFIDSFFSDKWPKSGQKEAEEWLTGFNALLQKYSNGHKYQNYPNRNNINYRWNYWGDVFNSLLFVKTKYDPTNLFTNEQGLTPYPEGADIQRSEVPSQFSDTKIVYEPRH
ncbi:MULTISPECIES: FAD-binding oxidoreductase [unclassified Leptolyngbya]|uniref:FAD-dependent oxidoreductase n=1 Tax=unclassified Leptolyngbya TaxID=2650499 RepID=UPI001682FDEF|nr:MULTISPECIES: FAD-binding oxidoreductase [unclassified Leptolyngbya]MBD1911999.1 FAD-binding oxidoreductase [Leptolyngbya sp. FACHB-8]MBD2155369.1 FAD-binding oxidoreductase [Leptolyngbya sp. FACHB-16]